MYLLLYICTLFFINVLGGLTPEISDTVTFPDSRPGPPESSLQPPKNGEQDSARKTHRSTTEKPKSDESLDKTMQEDMQLEELVRDVRRTGFGKKIVVKRKRVQKEPNVDQTSDDKPDPFGGTDDLEQDSTGPSEDHFFTHAREFKSELDHYLNHKPELNSSNREDIRHIQEHKSKESDNSDTFEEQHFLEYAREFKSELDRFLNKKELKIQSKAKVNNIQPFNQQDEDTVSSNFNSQKEEDFVSPQDFKADVERYFEKARTSPHYLQEDSIDSKYKQSSDDQKISKSENREESSDDVQFKGGAKEFKAEVEKYFKKARLSAKYASEQPVENNFNEKLSNTQSFTTGDLSFASEQGDLEDGKEQVGDKARPSINLNIDRSDLFEERNDFVNLPNEDGFHLTHIPVLKESSKLSKGAKEIQSKLDGNDDSSSTGVNRDDDELISGPYPPRLEENHGFTFVGTSRPYPKSQSKERRTFGLIEVTKRYPGSKKEEEDFKNVEGSKPYPGSITEEGRNNGHLHGTERYPGPKEEGLSTGHLEKTGRYPKPKAEGLSTGHLEKTGRYPEPTEKGLNTGHLEKTGRYPGPKADGLSTGHLEKTGLYPGPTEEGLNTGHLEKTGRYPGPKEEGLNTGDLKVTGHYPGPRRYPEPTEEGHSTGHLDGTGHYPGPIKKSHTFKHIEGSKRYPGSKGEEKRGYEDVGVTGHYLGSKSENGPDNKNKVHYPASIKETGHNFKGSRPYPRSKIDHHSSEETDGSKPYPISKSVGSHSFRYVGVPTGEGREKGDHTLNEGKPYPESKTKEFQFENSLEKVEALAPYPKQLQKSDIPKGSVKVFAPYPLATLLSNNSSAGGSRYSLSTFLRSETKKDFFENVGESTAKSGNHNLARVHVPIPKSPLDLDKEHTPVNDNEFPPYPPSNFPSKSKIQSSVHSDGKIVDNVESTKFSSGPTSLATNAPESNAELDISTEQISSPYPPKSSPYPPPNALPGKSSGAQFLQSSGEFNADDDNSSRPKNDKQTGNLIHVPVQIHKKLRSNLRSSEENVNKTSTDFENKKSQDKFSSLLKSVDSIPSRISNKENAINPDSFQIFNTNQEQTGIFVPISKSKLNSFLKNKEDLSKHTFDVFSTLSPYNEETNHDHVFNTLAIINTDHNVNKPATDNDFVPTLPHKFTYINHVSALSPDNQAVLPPESSPDKDHIPALPFRLHHLSKDLNEEENKPSDDKIDHSIQSDTVVSPKKDSSKGEFTSKESKDNPDLDFRWIPSTIHNKPSDEYGLPELGR